MEKTKLVDLGDWKAEIKRPPVWISTRWARALRGGVEPHEVAARVMAAEQGRDDSLPAVAAAEGKVTLTSEHLETWEREVYPHVVLRFVSPDGETVEREKVWLADLGVNRFYLLMTAVSDFVREADESFRGATA
jgi:hypothetical protein